LASDRNASVHTVGVDPSKGKNMQALQVSIEATVMVDEQEYWS
jgi:hypothetical protein